MTMEQAPLAIYNLSINARVSWQAHSLSNAGNNESNRTLARRQLLGDGSETDACSGNIAKHHHAVLLAEYAEASDLSLCPACRSRDGRRAAALLNHPDYADLSIRRILTECALCDAHGFLVTAKHEDSTNGVESRQRINKNTLIDFSYALALPDRHHETIQLHTRSGASKEEGQMLMKMSARSGDYALGVRYHCVGVGADTEHWNLIVTDAQVRRKRHRAILGALRDSLISPEGAFTATMLPHLTSLTGCIVAIETAGRAPLYSALQPDFIERLQVMQTSTSHLYTFESIDTFFTHMNWLIEMTIPATSKVWDPQDISLSAGVVPQTGEDQSL